MGTVELVTVGERCALLQVADRRWLWYRTRLQLVLPYLLVPDILSSLHDAPSTGHLGVTKTVERVQKRFYWYSMQHNVEDWCRQCEKCARRKSPQATAQAPLPMFGFHNKYIVVVGDYFMESKEAFAIPNQEAKTVAEKLLKKVISRYGVPEKIHSHQG